MEEALLALLIAAPPVTALVNPDHVTWAQRQGLPAVVLHLISGLPGRTLDGPSGLVDAVVQADCWGSTFSEAVAIARAVKATVQGHRSEVLRSVFVETERSDFEMGDSPEAANAPANFHRISLDLRVWHRSA